MADEAGLAAKPGGTPIDSTCFGQAVVAVDTGAGFDVWAYAGPLAGHVTSGKGAPSCPTATDGTWT
jgi:hypothetical protein